MAKPAAGRLRPAVQAAQTAADGSTALAQALSHAITLLRDEQLAEAEAALGAVLARWPDEPNALHYLGVLRHTQGRVDDAVALIRRAISAAPDNAGAWNNLGNVLLAAGRADDAGAAYQSGLRHARPDQPGVAEMHNNLGTLYRKLGRLPESVAACRAAIDVRPDFGDAWYNLSISLMAQGQVHEGLLANSKAIALWPRHLQSRDQVIRALLLLGERERAAALYAEWLAEDPHNPVVQHQLAACLGTQAPQRASDAYVQQVFDAFAESFDAKLEKLDYRAPEQVARALADAVGEAQGALDIVDVGCGTGLCGPLVRPWARQLAGCDLSVGMLRRARERKVYDQLHQAELVHYLATQPGHFDAVVCADTLCYFGALDAALAAARDGLRPGGWLVFTVEALADGDAREHALQANGRYAHGATHLRAALAGAGLSLAILSATTLRQEAGRPVQGWLVTAGRP